MTSRWLQLVCTNLSKPLVSSRVLGVLSSLTFVCLFILDMAASTPSTQRRSTIGQTCLPCTQLVAHTCSWQLLVARCRRTSTLAKWSFWTSSSTAPVTGLSLFMTGRPAVRRASSTFRQQSHFVRWWGRWDCVDLYNPPGSLQSWVLLCRPISGLCASFSIKLCCCHRCLFQILIDTAKELNFTCHPTGTAVTIEGPRFSTRAESNMFRQWGAHVVNMTTVPEATLAGEIGVCYASIALPTDYDCWKINEKPVSAVEHACVLVVCWHVCSYSLMQWTWFSAVSGCTWVTCISEECAQRDLGDKCSVVLLLFFLRWMFQRVLLSSRSWPTKWSNFCTQSFHGSQLTTGPTASKLSR